MLLQISKCEDRRLVDFFTVCSRPHPLPQPGEVRAVLNMRKSIENNTNTHVPTETVEEVLIFSIIWFLRRRNILVQLNFPVKVSSAPVSPIMNLLLIIPSHVFYILLHLSVPILKMYIFLTYLKLLHQQYQTKCNFRNLLLKISLLFYPYPYRAWVFPDDYCTFPEVHYKMYIHSPADGHIVDFT